MTLPGWTREPLVHFLLAGFVLFVALTWSSGGTVDPSSRVIAVDRERQAQLSLQFERTMGRAPTDAELATAIDQFVRDEVLYREALRLGLDQGDAVVRRRLVTKMDLSASAAAEAAQPDEAALKAYYEKHIERYTEEEKLSFDQLYFVEESDATAGKSALASAPDWRKVGEAISLPVSVEDETLRRLASHLGFGETFPSGLESLSPSDEWQGPVRSGFGWHLVRLRKRIPGKALPFDTVRLQVENDWRSAEIASRKVRAYQVLRDAYRVEIAE